VATGAGAVNRATKTKLAAKLKRYGVRQPTVVIDEALREKIKVGTGLAMLQMETSPMGATKSPKSSGFELKQQNIFGCDHGARSSAPYCNQAVTKDRVAALRRGFPRTMNGVGWTQLTWYELVNAAERAGGAHIPRYQMRIGFRQLRVHFDREHSIAEMFRAYNGAGSAAELYGRRAAALRADWLDITDGH
jgi:hypothetical protein